jgi:hypothetical protein
MAHIDRHLCLAFAWRIGSGEFSEIILLTRMPAPKWLIMVLIPFGASAFPERQVSQERIGSSRLPQNVTDEYDDGGNLFRKRK